MNWVIQNWPWVVLVLGALWLLRRWVSHGEQGRGHLRGDGAAAADLGPGGGVARVDEESTAQTSAPTLAIDAVTRKDVSPEHALTSIYRGRVYYFETAESRQRFEASPEMCIRDSNCIDPRSRPVHTSARAPSCASASSCLVRGWEPAVVSRR